MVEANGNGWGEYKRDVLRRIDDLEEQLEDIEKSVLKVDKDMAVLLAQRSNLKWMHTLLVPSIVAAAVAFAVKLLG